MNSIKATMSSPQSRFIKLVDALHLYKDYPLVVAEGVMEDGIWTMAAGQISPTPNIPESDAALDALVVVDQFVELFIGIPFWYSDLEEFELDQCAVTYGWPEDKLPDFKALKNWRYPPLVTIDRILHLERHKYDLSYVDLALKIERDGIYGYKRYPEIVKYSANSAEAQHALTAVSAYMADSNSDNPRHELYSPEDDPTAIYGWPRANFPEFEHVKETDATAWVEEFHRIHYLSRKSFFKADLYTVGRLLATGKATPALIQTAYEQSGIFGYDATGRLVHNKFESDPFAKPTGISKLESDLGKFAEPLIRHGVIDYELFEFDSFAVFGWPHTRLPDFAQVSEGLQNTTSELMLSEEEVTEEPAAIVDRNEKSARTAVDTENHAVGINNALSNQRAFEMVPDGAKEGYDLLILALLAFINGEFAAVKGTDPYTKQNDLITTILNHFGESYGLRRTSIATKFGHANALRTRVGLQPLRKVKYTDHLQHEHQALLENPRELFAVDEREDQATPPSRPIGGGTF